MFDVEPARANSSSIELSSGDYLDLLHPDPAVITARVIAHHLCQANRYAGAPLRPISVCEHTILVSQKLEADDADPFVVLMGLHHDDPEAFLHDLTRPLKDQLPPYRVLERKFEQIIWREVFGFRDLTEAEVAEIKRADAWALSCEAYYFMPSGGRGWWSEGLYNAQNLSQRQVAQWLLTTKVNLPTLWNLRHDYWASVAKTAKTFA